MRRDFGCDFLVVIALVASAFAQSVPLSPTQVPNATVPGPQRHNPPAQPQPQSGVPRTAPQPLTNVHAPYLGTIEGVVYWDATVISHKPAGSCNGLSVTVSLGTPLGGSGMEEFKPLSTASNNFKYVGSVGTDAVCTYGFDHVPVGQDVQVQVNVNNPLAFSPAAAPAVAITGPIKIINGKCNNLPPAVPSPSDLTSQWWTCGNYAYNVNFVLQPSAHIMSANGTAGLLPRSSSTQPTLLSNTPSQGMLGSGAGAAPAPLPAGIQTASTANIGPAHTLSFQGGSAVAATAPLPAATASLPPSSGTPPAVRANMAPPLPPGIQTTMVCGQDSTFRILGVTGLSHNTFMPSGKYTIWGCSFGDVANIKTSAPRQSQPQSVAAASPGSSLNSVFVAGSGSGLSEMIPVIVGANVDSWSDNSITVTFPSPSQLGQLGSGAIPEVKLYVIRGDGNGTSQTGYFFPFPPPPPPPSCAQGNAFLITSIPATSIQPGGQYKIYGCGFGSSGNVELYGGSVQAGNGFVAFTHIQLWTDTEIDFTLSSSDVTANPSIVNSPYVGGSTLTVTRSSDGNSIQAAVVFYY